jgi:hypothetical protein
MQTALDHDHGASSRAPAAITVRSSTITSRTIRALTLSSMGVSVVTVRSSRT